MKGKLWNLKSKGVENENKTLSLHEEGVLLLTVLLSSDQRVGSRLVWGRELKHSSFVFPERC